MFYFSFETIITHTEYLKDAAFSESFLSYPIMIEKSKNEDIHMKKANIKWNCVCYSVQDKARSFDLKIEKCTSTSTAAKQLSIHTQTVQRWVKQFNRLQVYLGRRV